MKISYKRIKRIAGRLDETSLIVVSKVVNEEVKKRGLNRLVKTDTLDDKITRLLLLQFIDKLEYKVQ